MTDSNKKQTRRTTMKDIAEALQLDRTTVSKALSGKPGLADKTRRLILETAREMGYKKDAFASSLMTGKNNILGLVLTDLTRGLFAPFVNSYQEAARLEDYGVLLCNLEKTADGQAGAIMQLELLRQQRVSGITFVSNGTARIPEQYYDELLAEGIPFNIVESRSLIDGPEHIRFDHKEAGLELTRYLIGLGHRRIAFVTYSPRMHRHMTPKGRFEGYLEAMKEAGLAPTTVFEEQQYASTCGGEVQLAYRLLADAWETLPSPTAVIGANDAFALGALYYFKDRGISVPEDVSLAGFDDLYGEMAVPRMTSMRMPVFESGSLAARLLISRIRNGEADERDKLTWLDYKVSVRDTTTSPKL